MHPEIIRAQAASHRADLLRAAARYRAGRRIPPAPHRPITSLLRRWRRTGRPCLADGAAARVLAPAPPAPAGVFRDGPEALGLRVYLTEAEARRLAGDCLTLLDQFTPRLADPAARPPDAVPLEVVVLSRQLPC